MSATNSRQEKSVAELSEDLEELAQALAIFSSRIATPSTQALAAQAIASPNLSPNTIRLMIVARRARNRYLPGDLFADPAWDILLELLEAEFMQRRVSVSALCGAAAVPPTTALRWVSKMEERGLVSKRPDPHDRRRIFVELAPETRSALNRYFAEFFSPMI